MEAKGQAKEAACGSMRRPLLLCPLEAWIRKFAESGRSVQYLNKAQPIDYALFDTDS
jgi:hypothetical protein